MSDDFMLPPVPLVSPERARDIARAYKALADQFSEGNMQRQAANAMRDSQWWLTYALSQTQRDGSSA